MDKFFLVLLTLGLMSGAWGERFILNENETITDTQTSLEWCVGPGEGTTWYEANDWVDGLGNGWRMPTVDELEEIHEAGIWRDDMGYFGSGAIKIWAGNTSSSEISGVYCLDPVSSALIVSFVGGEIYEVSKTYSFAGVFAVLIHTQMNPLASEPGGIYSGPSVGDTFSGPLSGMTFAYIPSGSFMMGSPSTEEGHNSDEAQHEVHIDSFEMMTTEVTQGMWEEVMGDNPSIVYPEEVFGIGENYPVYHVSWDDCQDFIDKLNEMNSDHTYRLPSEAEWEYSCRAGTTTHYYWGDCDSIDTILRYCWSLDNANSSTHPAATKPPNAWGLYNMSGNVWEWCQDRYTEDYSNCPTDGTRYNGPGTRRVFRGGSWQSNYYNCRSAQRGKDNQSFSWFSVGFRLARSVH